MDLSPESCRLEGEGVSSVSGAHPSPNFRLEPTSVATTAGEE